MSRLNVLLSWAFPLFLLVGAGLVFSRDAKPIAASATTEHQVNERVFLTHEEIAAASKASPEMEAVASLLHVPDRMRFGDWIWNEQGSAAGDIWVRVDLAKQLISVFRGSDEIGTAVIVHGADSHATPSGTFAILGKSEQHRSRSYDAPMPYSLWLTTDGVAIHASDVRIGRATHGCVGVPLEFAKRLYSLAARGDHVVIVGTES